ncbi:MAG TPA: asparagine synthase (glutamine-hydrolyzing) [Thermoanaerobaculia bacterium]|nr:asparagine synthase (glutamine-hydrolyzing) [Thermoanaerobaculia bacterium]
MCGFVGCFDLSGGPVDPQVLARMTGTLVHRGPDSSGSFAEGGLALGFRRLSIIDLATGDQPLFNEDRSLVLVCNGEIYNYRELTRELADRGHVFRTQSDVEVLLHLYEEHGCDLLSRLNGQFSFALYDRRRRALFAARDPYGINPFFYSHIGDLLLFGSEIKAILEHPLAPREVDLTGLDQILTFPGLVPPRTIFQGISSLEAGNFLRVTESGLEKREYWDLIYPEQEDAGPEEAESYYVSGLRERLERAVRYRLQADVPVGFYLSGGLDSSLVGALIGTISQEPRHSFSIVFPDREISEERYQRLMAGHLRSCHHEVSFDASQILSRLQAMIYHCECPVKETFDACALALSEAARAAGVPVVLAGQGADELFAGYMGYRFDQAVRRDTGESGLDALLEGEIRETLWGDPGLFYETDFLPLREVKSALYSSEVTERLPEFESILFPVVRADRIRGRHPLHQRSYLDFKLRLSEHLLSEHGDRMVLAHSVEGRYPFLDPDVVDFAVHMPPRLKLNDLQEKYVVKKAAEGLVPPEIIHREKFGFRSPGTPCLLQQGIEWVEDLLSYDRIREQGYFNPDVVEKLKTSYRQPGFKLNAHLQTDLLMVVLTFGILIDRFRLPSLRGRETLAC